ncbi:MAG: hypothetical protein OCD01_04845 [Fibrobacterales bacterium]
MIDELTINDINTGACTDVDKCVLEPLIRALMKLLDSIDTQARITLMLEDMRSSKIISHHKNNLHKVG